MNIGIYFKDIKKNMRIFFNSQSSCTGVPLWAMHYIISLANNGGQSMRELTQELFVDKAHTTRAISKLAKLGLIDCIEDENDRRIKRLYLTKKGQKLALNAKASMERWQECVFKDFSEDELSVLEHLIMKVYQNSQELVENARDIGQEVE